MRGHIFDRLEFEAEGFNPLHQRPDVGLFPPLVALQRGIVHLQTRRADLCGKAQSLVSELVELAHRDTNAHGLAPSEAFLARSAARGCFESDSSTVQRRVAPGAR